MQLKLSRGLSTCRFGVFFFPNSIFLTSTAQNKARVIYYIFRKSIAPVLWVAYLALLEIGLFIPGQTSQIWQSDEVLGDVQLCFPKDCAGGCSRPCPVRSYLWDWGVSLSLSPVCRRQMGACLGEGNLIGGRTEGLERSRTSESLVGVEEGISQHCFLFLQPGTSVL